MNPFLSSVTARPFTACALVATTASAQPVVYESFEYLPSGLGVGDRFGTSMQASDGRIAIGALGGGVDNGSVSIFDLETAAPLARIDGVADAGEPFGRFGLILDLDGDTLAVPDEHADATVGGTPVLDAGAVYVYDLADPLNPVQTGVLTSDAPEEGAEFGEAVHIGDDHIFVSARESNAQFPSGALYIFDRTTLQLVHKMRLEADGQPAGGPSGIASSGTTLALQSGFFPPNAARGVVFVYDLTDPTNPVQRSMLTRPIYPGGSVGAGFATHGRLDIVGDTVIASAPGEDINDGPPVNNGVVYLYDISDPDNPVDLDPIIGGPGEFLGNQIAASGDRLVLAANFGGAIGGQTGSGYIYSIADPADATLEFRLDTFITDAEDRFGWTAAIEGDRAVVGARGDANFTAGRALAYELSTPPCPADLAPPSGVLDLADVQAFVAAFTVADPAADLAPDGIFDLADIRIFLDSFSGGCPR